ncbi:MAG: diguanylate cyclase, partial [Candidatus Eremiobacteraeota bacterium]|nr:diguanylate cyclase [Candidatus Eremiobacteraeota bacterium]
RIAWSQWFAGFFAAVALFNLLVFMVLRQAPFLWYSGIMASMIAIEVVHSPLYRPGISDALGPLASPLGRLIALLGYFVCITFFSRSFLQTAVRAPKLDRLIQILLAVNLVPIFAECLLVSAWPLGWLDDLVLLALLFSLFAAGLTVSRKGDPSARYYMIAFAGAAFGALVNDFAARFNVQTIFTQYLFDIGVAWEAVFLGAALADRTHRIAQANQELALEKSRAEALASIDGLTGVANRRGFDLALETAWNAAEGSTIAVLVIDVDDFKLYNDTYGHQAGDNVLRSVARACEECTRHGEDLFARYGGEEFAAILPRAGERQALAVAERMRLAVHALAIPRDSISCITISIGVSIGEHGAGTNAHALLADADEALYRAKETGKDRAVVAAQRVPV